MKLSANARLVSLAVAAGLALLDLHLLWASREPSTALSFELPIVEWLPDNQRRDLFLVKANADGSMHFPGSDHNPNQDLVAAIESHPWHGFARTITLKVSPNAPYATVFEILRASASARADVVIESGDDDIFLKRVEMASG